MGKWTARALALIAALGILGSVAVLDAAPAFAACNPSNCTGQDPQTTGCASNANTLESFILDPTFYVELRYSSSCYAAWTKVTNNWTSNPGSQNLYVQIRAYSCPNADSSCFVGLFSQQALSGTYWTDMFNFGYWVRACYANYPTGAPTYCTNRR
jgi:hypothetical protein